MNIYIYIHIHLSYIYTHFSWIYIYKYVYIYTLHTYLHVYDESRVAKPWFSRWYPATCHIQPVFIGNCTVTLVWLAIQQTSYFKTSGDNHPNPALFIPNIWTHVKNYRFWCIPNWGWEAVEWAATEGFLWDSIPAGTPSRIAARYRLLWGRVLWWGPALMFFGVWHGIFSSSRYQGCQDVSGEYVQKKCPISPGRDAVFIWKTVLGALPGALEHSGAVHDQECRNM